MVLVIASYANQLLHRQNLFFFYAKKSNLRVKGEKVF